LVETGDVGVIFDEGDGILAGGVVMDNGEEVVGGEVAPL